ncbi:MAG: methionyl-tRNA formyltransferase [Spirochaetia bacterium]|nr:methionyl-tRNA formyltransferase [Spirochaetia bacterium]
MKIGYFGSPEISARLLSAIAEKHEIVFVVSNPDKPRGREGTPQPTAVSELALSRGFSLYRPQTLKDGLTDAHLASHNADAFVIFAYGRLLPRATFDIAPGGCFNLHASLLPELRGASPIQSALLLGKSKTGWTFQEITEELDAGDVLGQIVVPIDPADRTSELTERLMPAGISLTLEVLADLKRCREKAVKQESSQATFCSKISKAAARISWDSPAESIVNAVRGYFPSPVAWSTLDGKTLKILRANQVEMTLKNAAPGRIWTEKDRFFVSTGRGTIEILELQMEGKKALTTSEFLRGFRFREGMALV